MEIKWYGTATLAFSASGRKILFDPFLPMNCALPSPPLEELGSAGDIFITHGHFDHLNDVPRVMAAGQNLVYCSAETARVLLREGVQASRIVAIKPGDVIECGPFTLRVYRGKHIKFNSQLILKTVFNRRIVAYRENLRALLKMLRRYPQGQVLVFIIEAEGKRILHLGSLNLDPAEQYPEQVDLLSLPYQGRSDLESYALPFIRRFRPQGVYLHHFDDSFPPVSSRVDIKSFLAVMEKEFPQTRVIVPDYEDNIVI